MLHIFNFAGHRTRPMRPHWTLPGVRCTQPQKIARMLADVTSSPDVGTMSELRLTRTRWTLQCTRLFAPYCVALVGRGLSFRRYLTQRLISVSR